jgi:hypothetical protein
MRRLLIEEPTSRAAIWSCRVGFFAWLSLVVALLLARLGRLQPFQTLSAGLACGALAVIAIAFALFAFSSTWRSGARGVRSAVLGLLLGVGLLAYPALLCLRDLVTSTSGDITTDPAEPPQPIGQLKQLVAGAPAPSAATTIDAGLSKAITPLLIDEQINDALALALRAAGNISWHVTTVDYPRPPLRDQARFAATVPSFLIRWPSDAIVRLLQTEDGIRVDVRLVARQRWSLLRASDADIASYLERLETEASGKRPRAGR